MGEYTFFIEAEGMPDPRLDDIDDLYDALVQTAGSWALRSR